MSDPDELRESQPNAGGPHGAAGGMGVSSERVGPTGPGQEGTDGLRDTSVDRPPDDDAPPEQRAGNPEDNPTGIPPLRARDGAEPAGRSDGAA
ncbi:hypothetical protein EKO23_07990 [Nocardioides guangzhouensis]|uniref:Uncharacterized protein n=1 Tax=Nocardioides guangzhouensis TaxID=2497878 RepID=A0A4Q4ZHD5_9ACTN|nr:hypothetical protein [Nocardioides guangzhouensis]RYP86901.1 hypothetical protein EKO23_07990 [Nocardioides guangzhouensis]